MAGPSRHRLARTLGRARPVAIALVVAGCALRRPPEMILAPHEAVVFGQLLRGSSPMSGQTVKLFDQTESVTYDSLRSDGDGHYGFPQAPAGAVMVKATSSDSLNFSYVRFQILRGSSTERDSIPPMDLRAHGCAPRSPADGSAMTVPNPGAPLFFAWSGTAGVGVHYKVQLSDAADSTVWESTSGPDTTAAFNGIGTTGRYAGTLVPPGSYSWRVKVHFRNGVQAATGTRALTFAAASSP